MGVTVFIYVFVTRWASTKICLARPGMTSLPYAVWLRDLYTSTIRTSCLPSDSPAFHPGPGWGEGAAGDRVLWKGMSPNQTDNMDLFPSFDPQADPQSELRSNRDLEQAAICWNCREVGFLCINRCLEMVNTLFHSADTSYFYRGQAPSLVV